MTYCINRTVSKGSDPFDVDRQRICVILFQVFQDKKENAC